MSLIFLTLSLFRLPEKSRRLILLPLEFQFLPLKALFIHLFLQLDLLLELIWCLLSLELW